MAQTKKSEIYQAGLRRGFNVASWVDIPEIGSRIAKDVDWQGLGDVVTKGNVFEYMEQLANASEENDRQFSPFEFQAKELNELPETLPFEPWDVFDAGIQAGIVKNLKSRKVGR